MIIGANFLALVVIWIAFLKSVWGVLVVILFGPVDE